VNFADVLEQQVQQVLRLATQHGRWLLLPRRGTRRVRAGGGLRLGRGREPPEQAAAAEHAEALVLVGVERELLPDGDLQLVREAGAATIGVVRDAGEELKGEARLRGKRPPS
jgi:hypothetical protein